MIFLRPNFQPLKIINRSTDCSAMNFQIQKRAAYQDSILRYIRNPKYLSRCSEHFHNNAYEQLMINIHDLVRISFASVYNRPFLFVNCFFSVPSFSLFEKYSRACFNPVAIAIPSGVPSSSRALAISTAFSRSFSG